MSDWTEVLKKVPAFGMQGNEQRINQNIEQFQEKQITPFVKGIMDNLKQGQLPVFKIRVDKNAANTGPQGDTYVIGRDQLTPNSLGVDPERVKSKLQQVFKEAGYSARGAMFGKDMVVQIPKRFKVGGKTATDPRQLQARQMRAARSNPIMNTLRTGRRLMNPMNIVRDRRTRRFIEDNPNDPRVQGQF